MGRRREPWSRSKVRGEAAAEFERLCAGVIAQAETPQAAALNGISVQVIRRTGGWLAWRCRERFLTHADTREVWKREFVNAYSAWRFHLWSNPAIRRRAAKDPRGVSQSTED